MPHRAAELHDERLEQTVELMCRLGARSVLDLGCGAGLLLHRLLQTGRFQELVGLEQNGEALLQARAMLAQCQSGSTQLKILHGSFTESNPALTGFDAAVMLETIEHVPPQSLSLVETAVFGQYRPAALFMTTPNQEYNPLLGLEPGERRDDDHKFEWSRARFRAWAGGVARRNGYRVTFSGIGEWHADAGEPTQTALFTRADADAR
ncbi:MAG: methyltransferase domain-containing protein [Gammaproteobacteria bacterium]|nr:methyltransferase domain-containing protein [Gammaproteobacteria bacterium]